MKPSNKGDLSRKETYAERIERHERMIAEMAEIAARKLEDRIPTPMPNSNKWKSVAVTVERLRAQESPIEEERKSEDSAGEEDAPKKPKLGRKLTA